MDWVLSFSRSPFLAGGLLLHSGRLSCSSGTAGLYALEQPTSPRHHGWYGWDKVDPGLHHNWMVFSAAVATLSDLDLFPEGLKRLLPPPALHLLARLLPFSCCLWSS